MSSQSSYGSFERLNLGGKNVGAAMTKQCSSSGESLGCYNINIYINNNVQGVNNSVLVGSEVKMRDPGVCFSMRGVKFGKDSQETNRKRRNSSRGFLGILLVLVVAIIVLAFGS
ncbi:hypothetical protein Acr_13g0009320 [Actinidia rufa]|uniref:Uncharacterized protein n=1 Tax=Actinidia rufa TaxID=165716 RepID=A0A7J0FLE1_9ERIC|nr:hypothetical protein Acr_13g0009320 [Actinidia rufa]